MKLADHFRANLSSDFAAARRDITRAVLGDPEALRQLESDTELWLKFPVDVISTALLGIYLARRLDTEAAAWRVRHLQTLMGQLVETLYMRALDTWLDAEFKTVNLQELIESEYEPEGAARTIAEIP